MRSIALAVLPLLALTDAPAHAQDAAAGEKVFARCRACHTAEEAANKIGPSLKGVIGRTAGTYEGFRYSPNMKKAGEEGLVWNDETIAEFLKKPRDMIKGTRMAFPGLNKDEDIANISAYLKQFSE